MKATLVTLLGLPAALRSVLARGIISDEAVVIFDIQRRHYQESTFGNLSNRKRSSTLLSDLDLNDKWIFSGGYFLDIEVGTPPQQLQVLLDTGSSDLFIPSAEAARCLNHNCPGGRFLKNDSSTLRNPNQRAAFHTAYLDGSTANGTYVQDTVRLGSTTLHDHIFAVADELEVSPGFEGGPGPQYGIMGLSFRGQEASICASGPRSCKVNYTTPTVLDSLYEAGYIKSRSYSLHLHDVASQSGTILFGGLDLTKFSGELVTLSIQKDLNPTSWTYGRYAGQDLILTSVSSTVNGTITELSPRGFASTATLDSGASALSLPPSVYDQIIDTLPLVLKHRYTSAVLCRDADLDAYLTLDLTGTKGFETAHIQIPYSNLVVHVYEGVSDSSKPYLHNGQELCVFALAKGTATANVLGDPFLRSAYTVFSLDEKTISLAQASYGNRVSNIRAIGQGLMSGNIRR